MRASGVGQAGISASAGSPMRVRGGGIGGSRKVAIGLLAWVLGFVLMLLLAANVGAAQVGPGADAPVSVPVQAVGAVGAVVGGVAEQGRALFPPGYVVPSAPSAVDKKSDAGGDSSAWTALGSMALPLGIVLLVIFVGMGLLQRLLRAGGHLTSGVRAPAGVMEMLGRYPVGRGQNLLLIKLDQRVLLIGQTLASRAGSGTLSTLTEVAAGEDVASILLKVSESESTGPASAFNRMLGEAEGKAPAGGRGLAARLFGRSGGVVWDEALVAGDAVSKDEALRDRLSRLKVVASRGGVSGGAA